MDQGLKGMIPQGEYRHEGDQDMQPDLRLQMHELHGLRCALKREAGPQTNVAPCGYMELKAAHHQGSRSK
jgi:hypothetical protein